MPYIAIKAYPKDPMDNFNLGVVGPLKTTIRVTTRTLNSVTAGTRRMTVKWSGSKHFTGYDIRYSTDINFKNNVKTVRIADPKTYETVVGGLSSKKSTAATAISSTSIHFSRDGKLWTPSRKSSIRWANTRSSGTRSRSVTR